MNTSAMENFIFEGGVMQVVFPMILNVAGLFLVTLYFCKSKRVRIFMRTDEYMDNAIFAFRQHPHL